MTKAKQWTRRELRVGGVRLSYIERETEAGCAGAPVLMLHGIVAGGDCFRRLGDQLPDERRVVALDLPGGGYSERPLTIDVSFRSVAEIVAEAMSVLGMERPVIVGHSYGGAIALELAAWRPELLDAIILIAPAHPFSMREDLLVRFYLSAAGRWFARLLPRVPRRLMLEAFRRMPGDRRNVSYEQIEPYVQALRHPGTIAYVLRVLKSWKNDMEKLGNALRERTTEIPAFLLWGELDPVVPASTGMELMRHLGPSEQMTMPGVGHLPNDEKPEECGSLIRTWLMARDR
ncbi:MAG TPA: alpha/beta hydrolase [Bryocella sp.]|nr:alpha/beta hydrolase [Bryocella sp.]